MIYDTLKLRKEAREFDPNFKIPQDLMDSMLKKTWEVTPSKNNFMAYTVHVLGPEHTEYKEEAYKLCYKNEGIRDEADMSRRYTDRLPQYANILTCSHLLIFTLRLEDQPSPYQIRSMVRGKRYEAVNDDTLRDMYPTCSLEVGMFVNALSGLCLENEIDVAFTLCFRKNIAEWAALPFVTKTPLLIMTLGKGVVYTRDFNKQFGNPSDFYRPNYERIVNFVK